MRPRSRTPTSRSSVRPPLTARARTRPRTPRVLRAPPMRELSAIAAIAHRDFVKLLRDRPRIIADFTFPLLLIGLLGPALQAGFGSPEGLNLQTFVFTGVLGQTVWQSAALGVISLIADRDEDF